MLGEMHDLMHEFPEYKDRIAALRGSDQKFAAMMDEYDSLDENIRSLEESGVPVADETIEELKFKRVELKDRLYQYLVSSE